MTPRGVCNTILFMGTEIWKPVVGYFGLYEVSDKGRIRGLVRNRVLSDQNLQQYPLVCLSKNGKGTTLRTHVLVAEVFIGRRPDGSHVDHIDDDRKNNRADNLQYLTPLQNWDKAWKSGRKGGPIHDAVRRAAKMRLSGRSWAKVKKTTGLGNEIRDLRAYREITGGRRLRHGAKLGEAAVRRIRKALSEGVTGRRIAVSEGIGESMVSLIKNKKRWRELG